MKVREKEKAVKFRQSGFTYKEILEHLPVSRGSLSYWLRGIELTGDQKRRIYGKNLEIRRKFVEYNQQKRRNAISEKNDIFEKSYKEINSLSKQELKLVGVALYWAEGYKSENAKCVEFVNSDPIMIRFIMKWLRDICGVVESKFRIKIQIYNAENIKKAHEFWSFITGVPVRQFTRPYVRTSPTSQKKIGVILVNGICHIRVSDTNLLAKIKGWIKGLGGPIV